MSRRRILLGIGLVVLCLFIAQSAHAKVGYVDFELLFSAHPEYSSKNMDLQEKAMQLTEAFQAKVLEIDDEQELLELELVFEQQLDEYADSLRMSLIQSIHSFIAIVADANEISVVLPNTSIIYGGIDLTKSIVEAMYNAYGISVPSHLRLNE